MKIWQWARCLVCPVCGELEHEACRNVQTGCIMQYHTARLRAGRELMKEMNEVEPQKARVA